MSSATRRGLKWNELNKLDLCKVTRHGHARSLCMTLKQALHVGINFLSSCRRCSISPVIWLVLEAGAYFLIQPAQAGVIHCVSKFTWKPLRSASSLRKHKCTSEISLLSYLHIHSSVLCYLLAKDCSDNRKFCHGHRPKWFACLRYRYLLPAMGGYKY